MPHYHLHLADAHLTAPDVDGIDLPDMQAAVLAAIKGIRGLLADEVREMGRIDLRGEVVIMDDRGISLQVITFAEAVSILEH